MIRNQLLRLSACGASLMASVAADEVRLDTHGVIRGDLIEVDRSTVPSDVVTIRTPYGDLAIERDRVRRVAKESPAEAEYRRRAPSVSDTVEAQFALAQWCRDNGLGDEMRDRLRRVLELQPNHQEARALLGYQNVDGQWMTREEVLASRGLLLWQGEYRTRQEIALLEQAARLEEEQRAWRKRIARWSEALDSTDPDRAREASEELSEVADPAAVPELLSALDQATSLTAQRRFILAVGRTGSLYGLKALASLALVHPDPEIRSLSVEQVVLDGRPGIATPFVTALRSKDNILVNHAGDALAALGAIAAIDPLIDALVTKHQRKIGNDSGGDTYSFNANSGTFGFGGGGPKIISSEIQNPRVLAALVRLTGVNFLYDKQAWRDWLAAQQGSVLVDLRRDP